MEPSRVSPLFFPTNESLTMEKKKQKPNTRARGFIRAIIMKLKSPEALGEPAVSINFPGKEAIATVLSASGKRTF